MATNGSASPLKRVKRVQSVARAVYALLTSSEPALLANIASFIPRTERTTINLVLIEGNKEEQRHSIDTERMEDTAEAQDDADDEDDGDEEEEYGEDGAEYEEGELQYDDDLFRESSYEDSDDGAQHAERVLYHREEGELQYRDDLFGTSSSEGEESDDPEHDEGTFLPSDCSVENGDDDDEDSSPHFEATIGEDPVLATIVALCRAFPTVGKQLGPKSESFWRSMVLQRFDFTVDPVRTFNVGDVRESYAERDEFRKRFGDQWFFKSLHYLYYHRQNVDGKPVHPIQLAIDEYAASQPQSSGFMLEHNLAFWPSIGAFFRPAEYAFLGDIQQGTASITTWPRNEDAFTLYRDLALLKYKLGKMEGIRTFSERTALVYPCLLGRLMNGEFTDDGFEMLKHCDFLPLYWDGWMHPRWSGLDEPLPPPMEIKRRKITSWSDWRVDENEYHDRTKEEKRVFPLMPDRRRHQFECFRRVVHESFDDWRRLHVSDDERASVEFYIGRRTTS